MNRNLPTAPTAAPMFSDDELKPITQRKLIAYRYNNGTGQIHFATRSGSEVDEFMGSSRGSGRVVLSVVTYPANFDELGSSAKDLWEERQMESIRNAHSAASQLDRLARRLERAERPTLTAATKRSRMEHIMREAEEAGIDFAQIAARADELAAQCKPATLPARVEFYLAGGIKFTGTVRKIGAKTTVVTETGQGPCYVITDELVGWNPQLAELAAAARAGA